MIKEIHAGFHEIKYFKGVFWLKVFYHDMSESIGFYSEDEAIYTKQPNKYSILRDITSDYKQNNGLYEFLLIYPETPSYNRWLQGENPLDEVERGQETVSQYKPINIGLRNSNWGGLAKSSSNVSKYSLLNGTPHEPTTQDWCYAIGMFNGVTWNGFTKLPGNTGSKEYNEVYLWIRIPIPYSFFHKENMFNSHLFSTLIFILISCKRI